MEKPNFVVKVSQIENFSSYLIAFILIAPSLFFLDGVYNSVVNLEKELNLSISGMIYPLTLISCAIFLIKPTYNFFLTRSKKFIFSDDKLIIKQGILIREEDPVELFRIKDISISQPIHLRPLNAYNVVLFTTDISHPRVTMKNCINFKENEPLLRNRINYLRQQGEGREVDVV